MVFMATADLFGCDGSPRSETDPTVTPFRCVNGISVPVGEYIDLAASGDTFCATGYVDKQLVCWEKKRCE